MSNLHRWAHGCAMRLGVLAVMAIGVLLFSGCQPSPTPVVLIVTATQSPATMTEFVPLTKPATRTPLPTLTPSAVRATDRPAQAAAIASATVVVAKVSPTSAPIISTINATLAATVAPSSTSALIAQATQIARTQLPTPASLLPGSKPPLDITLPAGWKVGYSVVPVREPLIEASMNLALYTGPLTKGTGTIVVLWGFPSLGAPPTQPDLNTTPAGTPTAGPTPLDYQSQLLWADGLRLLQGTVVDITCNVGRYDQRTFMIGGHPAIGAYFNATCPDVPNTVGWFAGLNQFGGNYLFYVYIDPIEAYNDGRSEMQKLLDTVVFHAPTPGTQPATPTK